MMGYDRLKKEWGGQRGKYASSRNKEENGIPDGEEERREEEKVRQSKKGYRRRMTVWNDIIVMMASSNLKK